MTGKQTIAFVLLVILSMSQAGISSARTANFRYSTIEVPDGWVDMIGPGGAQVKAPDGTLLIQPGSPTVLSGAKPKADGSPDMDGILKLVDQIKTLAAKPGRLKFPMIQDFATKDLGHHRSLMRAIYRMNASTIIAQYYVIGPTYVVPFSVASKHGIDDTIARLDPIFASLQWLGAP